MALLEFAPVVDPAPGSGSGVETNIIQPAFGDGYEQTAAAGLNHVRQTATLLWPVLSSVDADALVLFFEVTAGGGVLPFRYTLPETPVERVWRCRVWQRDYVDNNIQKFSAKLREVFDLV